MRILVVEDEKKIASFVMKGLQEQGFTVEVCANGNEAFTLVTTQTYDVIVLDIMLPGRDGMSILKGLRERKQDTPVILLTARAELRERLEGLNQGADDYLTKPFFVEELIARVHAVARRSGGERTSLLQAGDLTVDLLSREVTRAGVRVELTTREFTLLEFLMRAPGRVLTRTQILQQVWGYDFDPQTNLVDVYIQRVRRKLAPAGTTDFIETVRGAGYRFAKQPA